MEAKTLTRSTKMTPADSQCTRCIKVASHHKMRDSRFTRIETCAKLSGQRLCLGMVDETLPQMSPHELGTEVREANTPISIDARS